MRPNDGAAAAVAVPMGTQGLLHHRGEGLTPADWVTLARATFAVAIAALIAYSLRAVRAGRPPGVAGGGRAGIGRGRRMGRAANAHDGEGRSLRCRGRCVSDPDPQRVCRPIGRRLGARDRRRALRVPRRRVGAAVDRRTAAPALLAQGRRRDTGDCADRRGHAHPVARSGHGGARRGPDPALGVLRPRRTVAVGQPARHAAATADG